MRGLHEETLRGPGGVQAWRSNVVHARRGALSGNQISRVARHADP
jgi:hypothetical protein